MPNPQIFPKTRFQRSESNPKPSKFISLVRRARPDLRANGLNSSELSMLEEIALLLSRGSTMRVLRGSYLANSLGISRQWANSLLRRLSDLNLIIRFKTGLVRLNIEKLNNFSKSDAKIKRRKMPKLLKTLLEYGRGNTGIPNKEVRSLENKNSKIVQPANLSRGDAEAYWLQKMGLTHV